MKRACGIELDESLASAAFYSSSKDISVSQVVKNTSEIYMRVSMVKEAIIKGKNDPYIRGCIKALATTFVYGSMHC